MKEIGIDISTNRSKSVEEFDGREFDFVITVCDNAGENCPYFPAHTKLIHHSFADPAAVEGDEETRLQAFRKARDEIHRFLLNLSASIKSRYQFFFNIRDYLIFLTANRLPSARMNSPESRFSLRAKIFIRLPSPWEV